MMTGTETMTTEEMKDTLITQYCDYQEIKEANDGHENRELDYKIKKTAARLASLGVNVEDLNL
ncbi:MAG: hypothetical protein IJP92_07005 [Lachnospiraceae bacterium]|nr:hypothetical protein [Lachnospiraceae bacterium]